MQEKLENINISGLLFYFLFCILLHILTIQDITNPSNVLEVNCYDLYIFAMIHYNISPLGRRLVKVNPACTAAHINYLQPATRAGYYTTSLLLKSSCSIVEESEATEAASMKYFTSFSHFMIFLIFNKLFFQKTAMAEENQKEPLQSVQVFGRKKTATAVAYCKRGKGILKVNGRPLELVEPKALQFKLMEPVLLLGKDRYSTLIVDLLTEGTIIV